jgi:hypothetical protein
MVITYTEVMKGFRQFERLFNHSVEIPSQVSRSKRQVGPCKAFKARPKTQGTSTLLSLCNGNGWAPHRIAPPDIPSLAMKKVFPWKNHRNFQFLWVPSFQAPMPPRGARLRSVSAPAPREVRLENPWMPEMFIFHGA